MTVLIKSSKHAHVLFHVSLSMNLYISDEVNEYNWLFANNIVKLELSKLTYKILKGCVPDFFQNYIILESETMQTRNKTYCVPSLVCKTAVGKKSFRYRAQNNWLNIPPCFTSSIGNSTFYVFKKKAKNLLINNQYEERMRVIFEMIDNFEFESITSYNDVM